ncbi:SPOR domain-containing protein [Sinanaerobacter chloroacetimidivorans]|jgi:cell division septation protein DedD|uniref:SPOR domain-containing protein n=1 Tax=Sinanaerobacter chloroacetimidivorans TaxID=2818044 RepID=A0A8J7VX84_9FIRM|nr:SPOR domain-containing protein [Sinanaerobacter chloroacetimidivorans]MBR0596376.1 SPOR domain-containing protein [Sinanaerobacter chloroacetimidivorans]
MGRYNRYPRYRSNGMGFSVFILFIILAVAAGYVGTKYVIYPYFLDSSIPMEDANDNPQKVDETTTDSGVDVVASLPSIVIDQQDIKDTTTDTAVEPEGTPTSSQTMGKGPYSVQFGSFTTKAAAEALCAELSQKGIYAYSYESNGSHKVLGLPYSDKEKAKEAAAIVSATVTDVFVVDLSSLI